MSSAGGGIAPARALAYEVIRATFERDAHTERAFREAAEVRRARGPGAGPGPAARIRRGAAPRHQRRRDRAAGRAPAADARRAVARGAATRPLRAALLRRRPPTTPRSTRRSSSSSAPGAAHAGGLVNAVLRRAARERADASRTLLGDDSTPEAAAVAHSAPLWLARMWWEELGAEGARSLLAACNQPAEVAMRFHAPRARAGDSRASPRRGVEAVVPDAALAAGAPPSRSSSSGGPGRRCRRGLPAAK